MELNLSAVSNNRSSYHLKRVAMFLAAASAGAYLASILTNKIQVEDKTHRQNKIKHNQKRNSKQPSNTNNRKSKQQSKSIKKQNATQFENKSRTVLSHSEPVCTKSKNLENSQTKAELYVNYHFTRLCNYKCGFCFHTGM